MLSALIEPPPGKASSPQPVVRQPRRVLVKSPTPVEAVPVVIPEKPDWAAIYAQLPREDDGSVNWVQAFEQKLIVPKGGFGAEAKEEEPLDLDLEFVPKGQPEMKVVFPHKIHTEWLVCDNCHTAIFEMQRSPTPIAMADIEAGKSCGICHREIAFAPAPGCGRCHVGLR